MAIADVNLEDWFVAAASNAPTDTTFIRRDLPGQWRNIKSVFRGSSLEKEWLRTGKVPSSVSDSGGGIGSMAFVAGDGDLTSTFTILRKVRMRPTAGGTTVYAAVQSSIFIAGQTVVTLLELVSVPIAGVAYQVDVGAESPTAAGMPFYGESGQLTITDPATTGVATFAHVQPNTDYFIRPNLISATTAVGGALLVVGIVKTATNATFTLNAAPGGGLVCVWGWTLLREL